MIKSMLLLFVLFTYPLSVIAQKMPVYKDKNAAIESRIEDLMKRMTIEEKVLQLNQQTLGDNPNDINYRKPSFPLETGSLLYFGIDPVLRNSIQKKAVEETRLGIPILFAYDVIHGLRTVYPISLAQGCSWDTALVRKACAMAAKEAKLSGIDWTFSPMVDVARDPRWGRVAEGYGEDPYTNAMFGVASVRGYQGKRLSDPYSVAACLKHFVAYGLSEGGRDYRYTDVSGQSLWETYMVPYQAGVNAGAATLMSGYNDINGIPASANPYTLTEILKDRWEHDGFVISDWYSVENLVRQRVAKDRREAGLKAFMSGVDMDMADSIYKEELVRLVTEGKVPVSRVDDAVRRILRIKFRLGLFDNPYSPIVDDRYLLPESKAVAFQLSIESMVLLKNSQGILPLSSDIQRVALVGPLANNQEDLLGSWSFHGQAGDVVSIADGLKKEFGNRIQFSFAKGCDFEGTDESGFAEAISIAQTSDLIIACLGEKKNWSGENASRSSIALPVIQEKLVQEIKKTGKPLVLVLVNGRPLELVRIEPLADAILEMWQPGIMGGEAVASLISGRENPSGKLDITFPLTTGQIPVYYSMRPVATTYGIEYQDIPAGPMYWFGHGLSYTTFKYDTIQLSDNVISKNQKIIASVDVANTGGINGKEAVLWYISTPTGNISRPLKELKYFEKKEIKAGQKVVYNFEIDPIRDLSYPDANGNSHIEPGEYILMAGNQRVTFELKK